MKDITQVTDVDVRINETAGLMLNEHSGVVELVVRTVEHRGTRECGCAVTETGYTTLPIDEDVLCHIIDGFGDLKAEHFEENLEESLRWQLKHDKHTEDD